MMPIRYTSLGSTTESISAISPVHRNSKYHIQSQSPQTDKTRSHAFISSAAGASKTHDRSDDVVRAAPAALKRMCSNGQNGPRLESTNSANEFKGDVAFENRFKPMVALSAALSVM